MMVRQALGLMWPRQMGEDVVMKDQQLQYEQQRDTLLGYEQTWWEFHQHVQVCQLW